MELHGAVRGAGGVRTQGRFWPDREEGVEAGDPRDRELLIYEMPNGLKLLHRSTSDPYIIQESGGKGPWFFRHGDLSPKDTVLDIGAQIGIATLWASTEARCVHSYEPEKENFSLLKRNCEQVDNCEIHNFFVGGNRSPIERAFYVAGKDLSSHSAYLARGRRRVKVPCVRIGDVLAKSRPDFVKMDCEGAEYEILRDGFFDGPLPEVVSFEAHFSRKSWHELYRRCIGELKSHGYRVQAKEESKGWPVFVHATRRM